jgi:hypothetical protein
LKWEDGSEKKEQRPTERPGVFFGMSVIAKGISLGAPEKRDLFTLKVYRF